MLFLCATLYGAELQCVYVGAAVPSNEVGRKSVRATALCPLAWLQSLQLSKILPHDCMK